MKNEQRVLCLTARTQAGPEIERQLIDLLRGPLDWELLWGQGHLHEVLPLLVVSMRRIEAQIDIPASWRARALRRQYATLIRNTTLAEAMNEVLAALRQVGVAGIPVKGVVLAETLYGGLGMRSLGDLDVLVRPADLPAARAQLRALGFAPAPHPSFDDLEHPFHDPPYYRPAAGGAVCLELHWGLWSSRFFHLGIDTLWQRSVAAQINGSAVQILSPEDTLLHLAIHRSRSPLRLRFVCDIAELLRKHGAALDWSYVLEQAQAAGARTALFLALTLARDLLDAQPASSILQQLRVGRLKYRLLDQTCGEAALFRPAAPGDLDQQPALLLRLLEQDGVSHILWNVGLTLVRKGRKQIFKFQQLRSPST